MVDVLLGLQWGDEGKGKIVDFFAPHYDVIARFQGGPNAGHTLYVKGKKVAFIGFAHNNIVPNVNDLDFAKQLVTDAVGKADIVVVSFHGESYGLVSNQAIITDSVRCVGCAHADVHFVLHHAGRPGRAQGW